MDMTTHRPKTDSDAETNVLIDLMGTAMEATLRFLETSASLVNNNEYPAFIAQTASFLAAFSSGDDDMHERILRVVNDRDPREGLDLLRCDLCALELAEDEVTIEDRAADIAHLRRVIACWSSKAISRRPS